MSRGPSHERFIEIDGFRLRAVLDEGPAGSPPEGHSGAASDRSGPVLVLHGFTGSSESMQCVVPLLGDRHRVVRLDLIGHGGSDSPARPDAWTMEACAEQIARVVDALALARPHLLGYSMGGRAAIAAAVRRPGCFRSLSLIGATAGIGDPALRRERITSDRALADRLEKEGIEAFVDAWMALPIFASQAKLGSEAQARARAQRLRNDPVALARSLRGMGAGAQAPLFDRLADYPGPVLLVVGEQDAKFREIAARLAAGFPDARVRVVGGAGHAAHLEAPDAFAVVLRDFLSTVDAASVEATPRTAAAAATTGARSRGLPATDSGASGKPLGGVGR